MLNKIPSFVLIILISLIIGLFLFLVTPTLFTYFSLTQGEMASAFIVIFILVSALYSAISSGKFKKLITDFIIWLLIILIAIILYSFKGELKDVTRRVASSIFPSYAISKPGEILVSRNMDGHFYIGVMVNNTPIKFMIDTGASDVALTKADAKRLNFNLLKLKYTKIYSTANGLSAAAPVILENFIMGAKTFNNINASVTSGDNDMSLLGMSVISRFKSFRIDGDILVLSY